MVVLIALTIAERKQSANRKRLALHVMREQRALISCLSLPLKCLVLTTLLCPPLIPRGPIIHLVAWMCECRIIGKLFAKRGRRLDSRLPFLATFTDAWRRQLIVRL